MFLGITEKTHWSQKGLIIHIITYHRKALDWVFITSHFIEWKIDYT